MGSETILYTAEIVADPMKPSIRFSLAPEGTWVHVSDHEAALAAERAEREQAESVSEGWYASAERNFARAEAAEAQLSALRSRFEGLVAAAPRGVVSECCGHYILNNDWNTPDPLEPFCDREVVVIPVDELRELLGAGDGAAG